MIKKIGIILLIMTLTLPAHAQSLVYRKLSIDSLDPFTEAQLEAQLTAVSNLIVSTEIDTFSKLDALVADKTLVNQSDGAVWTGTHDFGGAVLEVPNSATLPGTCAVGDIYMYTAGASGQQIYACESANNWVLQGDGGGSGAGSCWELDASSDLMPVASACTDTLWEQDANGDLMPKT